MEVNDRTLREFLELPEDAPFRDVLGSLFVLEAADGLDKWMETPNEVFDGKKPCDMVGTDEEIRLERMMWRLIDGVPID